MTSQKMRENPLFILKSNGASGKWGIPIIKKQELGTDNIELIACSDTKANDDANRKKKRSTLFCR